MRRVNWGGSLGLGLTVWLLVCGFLFQREQLDAPDVVSVKEYSGVQAAVTAIGTAPRTLLIPDVQTIAASLTIPVTLTLRFVSAGQLSINTGVMVTYLGSTADWPRRQIFTGPGATPGVIFTRSGETVRAYPQWWGAAGDGAADDTLPCQRAIDAVGQSGGGQVYFPAGTYKLASKHGTGGPARSVFVSWDNVTLEGAGEASVLSTPSGVVPGGNVLLIGGMTKAATPAARPTAFNSQKWYVFSPAPTYYPMKAASRGDKTIKLAAAADAAHFAVGDYIYIRTGQTINGSTTEPDAEINQVDAVDRGTGTLTVKWPLAKPYAQEYFIADTSGKTSTTPTAHPAVFGVANVTDRTITNVTIRHLAFRGPSDATFIAAGQIVGLTVTDCVFMSGRALLTAGTYRKGIFSHNREHHDGNAFDAFVGSCATGTTDVVVSENTLTGKGFIHIHEGSANVRVVDNDISSESTANTDVAVSVRARGYGIQIVNNRIRFIRAAGTAIFVSEELSSGDGVIEGNVLTGGEAGLVDISVGARNWVVKNNTCSGKIRTARP